MQIIAYRFFENDADFTLSRVLAVHKEGSKGEKVVNGDTWVNTKADGRKSDDRKLRGISETSEDQYVNGRDDSYPGRVYFKVPWLGTPLAWVGGDSSIVLYASVVAFCVYSIVLAGQEAKRARALLRPRIPGSALSRSQ